MSLSAALGEARYWCGQPDAQVRQRLRNLLDETVAMVPYYRHLGDNGRAPALAAFPVIGKKRFVDNLDALMSDAYAGFERVDDPRAAGPRTLVCEFTSGSSGYPLRCYKTVGERTRLALSLLRKRTAIYREFTPDAMFGFIHNPEFETGSYAESLGNLSAANIGRVLTYLRDVRRPAVLHGNTMLLVYYADYIAEHGFDLGAWQVAFIESVSESMSPEQKRHIEARFRTTVYDCYGCLECYNLAYACRDHQLHLNENVIVEVLDPTSGENLTAAGAQGELVLTSLVNRAQPFIRYKTGDIGSLDESACACGSAAPVVRTSGRRTIDYLKLLYRSGDPQLTICGYDIFATVMYRLVHDGHDVVSWYNVVQTELDAFDVLYARKAGFSPSFFALFARYAQEELGRPARFAFQEKDEHAVLAINRKERVFRSLLQNE